MRGNEENLCFNEKERGKGLKVKFVNTKAMASQRMACLNAKLIHVRSAT